MVQDEKKWLGEVHAAGMEQVHKAFSSEGFQAFADPALISQILATLVRQIDVQSPQISRTGEQREAGASADAAAYISELIDQLSVERGSGETPLQLRLQLKSTVLLGTELIIRREGGGLSLTFATSDGPTFQLLSGLQDHLSQHLSQKFPNTPFQVQIQRKEGRAESASESSGSRSSKKPHFLQEKEANEE